MKRFLLSLAVALAFMVPSASAIYGGYGNYGNAVMRSYGGYGNRVMAYYGRPHTYGHRRVYRPVYPCYYGYYR